MNLIKGSYILGLIAALFAFLEKKFFESAFYNNLICRQLIPLWRIIDRKWDESFCMCVLRRDGAGCRPERYAYTPSQYIVP